MMTSEMKQRIASFLEDYNTLLDEFNDMLGGIDDAKTNRKCTKMSNVRLENIYEYSEYIPGKEMVEEYNSIMAIL